MSNIRLCDMTKELCREYHQQFSYDPDIFIDAARIKAYIYSRAHSDAHWQRQCDLKRVHLAIMLENSVIGEIVLKVISIIERNAAHWAFI